MAATTVLANHLRLSIDPEGAAAAVWVECQVVGLTFTQPAQGEPQLVFTACPNTTVDEPGDPVNGALSGEVMADFGATGVSRLLIEHLDEVVTFDLWLNVDDPGGTKAQVVHFTGTARVRPVTITWTPRKNQRHNIDLAVLTATPTFDATPPAA
jgi:hypothetical protein